MTTPTQTEYGPEIVVDGVRPDGLTGDVSPCMIKTASSWCIWLDPYDPKPAETWAWSHDDGEPNITAIKLRADHPLYTVLNHNAKHGTQFKYWPGGDEAPGNYDGGAVLLDNPVDTMQLVYNPAQWTPNEVPHLRRVIGYTPKPCATSVHSADATTAKSTVVEPWPADVNDPSKVLPSAQAQPDFVPCERTLRMAIEKVSAIKSHTIRSAAKCALETLLPKSVRAEELARSFSLNSYEHVSDEDMGLLRLFAHHLIAQGEIRG